MFLEDKALRAEESICLATFTYELPKLFLLLPKEWEGNVASGNGDEGWEGAPTAYSSSCATSSHSCFLVFFNALL